MPQALQLFANKPQTPDFGAGTGSAQDTESGENQRFSSVLDDRVSQAQETPRPSTSRSPDKSAAQTTVKNKEDGLQDTAASGKDLPQQAADVDTDVLPQDTTLSAQADSIIDSVEADALKLAADSAAVEGETLGQSETDDVVADIAPLIQTTPDTPDTDHIVAAEAAPPVSAGIEINTLATPAAATVTPDQRPAGEAQIASHAGQSGHMASLVASKVQTELSQQARNTGDEPETDSLLLPVSNQDDVLSAKQQAGEFSTKLRGLIDQVRRALGVGQNTAANGGSSQVNTPSNPNGTAPLISIAQQAGDVSTVQNTATPTINIGLKQEGWDEAMGQRVQWMVSRGIQKADIRLNPPNLGPLEVRINMTDDGADVRFISHHSVVRDSVESAMPRLREMLAEQGIDLANVDVSGHSLAHGNAHQDGGQGTGENSHGLNAHDNTGHDNETQVITSRVSQGMLDLFA